MKTQEGSPSKTKGLEQTLKAGGIAIFPTDTVFGIGCRYDAKESVAKISAIKKRPPNMPFPLLVSTVEQAAGLAKITPSAQTMIKKHWPGGLTIILPSSNSHPVPSPRHPELVSGSIGFR